MFYRFMTIVFLVVSFSVNASAELPLRIGADQTGKSNFVGGIARFSFYETLTANDVAALAKTKPDSPSPIQTQTVTLTPSKTPQTKTFAGVNANILDESHFIEFTADAKLQKIGAVEGWIYLDEKNQGKCRIFDRITPGGSDGWLVDLFPGRKIRVINGTETVQTNAVLPVSEWVHLAVVFDDSGYDVVYLNGKSLQGNVEQVVSALTPPEHSEIVWCSKPARNWFEANPVGNGHLGTMIHGNVFNETITLNEDTLWSGEPRDYQRPENYKVLPEIRKLLFEGKHDEAQKLITDNMTGPYNESYMPLGNLLLRIPQKENNVANSSQSSPQIKDYRRELDLKNGVAKSVYTLDGVRFERETFASFPDNVIVFQIKSDQPQKISLDVSLSTLLNHVVLKDDDSRVSLVGNAPMREGGNRWVVLTGNAPTRVEPSYTGTHPPKYIEGKGMRFVQAIHVVTDSGSIEKPEADSLKIRNAGVVRIYFTAGTSYSDSWTNPAISEEQTDKLVVQNLDVLNRAVKKPYEQLRASALTDYQSFYNRVKFDIPSTDAALQPMEWRLCHYTPESDPQLAALYYQFGRYLLIAGSRSGSQPLNLQGIWNKDIQPAWSANWTMNCNAEINYWAVETANLSELFEPFVKLTKELTVDGSKTAKNLYNARGWVAHHNIDLWRTTYPVGQPAGKGAHWALYQVGGAWACQPVYDHYLYTGDKKYLADVYPVLKGAALFFLDTLQKNPDGFLVTNPAISFENFYRLPSGVAGWASCGSTQDTQIVRALLRNTLDAAKTLGEDESLQKEIAETLLRLAQNKVSPTRGDLQEWVEDWDTNTPHNGQLAHGWALNPDWDISPIKTPELAAAFRKTLEIRKPWMSYNCASWIASMSAGNWARLFDGEMVETVLNRHVKLSLRTSLVSTFGQGGASWQTDGNLGMTSAIGETLLQSHPYQADAQSEHVEIHLLPALLPSWKSGQVSGLCARGGFVMDNIVWNENELTATIRSTWGTKCKVRYGEKVTDVEIPVGGTKTMKWER